MALSTIGPPSDIYKFQLVEFVRRGPITTKSIDIVPSRWVDTKNGRTAVSKFMPPPYTVETNELLLSLIKADADAPKNWPVYSIRIRGQAHTYENAVKKLKKLESQPYVFTTDSDIDPATKSTEITKKIIKVKKYAISEETTNAMSVPPMNLDLQDNPSDPRNESITDVETSDSSNEKKEKARKSKPKFTTKPSPHVSKQKRIVSTVSNSVKLKKKQETQKTPFTVEKRFGNDKGLEHETEKTGITKTQKHTKEESVLATIVKILEGIAVDVREVLANQNTMMTQLNPSGDRVAVEKFSEKHVLNVPFRSHAEFITFNEQLQIKNEFRKEFISSLDSLLDRELALSKSLTNICKKYLSRDLALQYTVLRKVPGKSLLKNTMFYDCVLGVAIQTHKDHLTGKKITEQIVDSALGKVINNAKDWDGQRQQRALAKAVKAATVTIAGRDKDKKAARGPVYDEDSSHDEESADGESGSDHVEPDMNEMDVDV